MPNCRGRSFAQPPSSMRTPLRETAAAPAFLRGEMHSGRSAIRRAKPFLTRAIGRLSHRCAPAAADRHGEAGKLARRKTSEPATVWRGLIVVFHFLPIVIRIKGGDLAYRFKG